MTDSVVLPFKRPPRRPLAGADRRCCHNVLLLIGRTLAARPLINPTIHALGTQARSIAVALKINPYFYPYQRTKALFSDLEMQNMLDGLDRLIDIVQRCHGNGSRAVTAAKKLRSMLEREYWRYRTAKAS